MVLENLEHEVDTVSRLLIRLLHVRDKRAGKLVGQYSKLTAVLRNFAKRNGERQCSGHWLHQCVCVLCME